MWPSATRSSCIRRRPAACAAPAGRARTCTAANSFFPGLDRNDGGMAEYLLTSARACVKLDPETQPEGRRRTGRRGHHGVPRGSQGDPALYPGTTCAVIGAGGLGHIGIQCLAALTATNIIVVDRNPDALKLAEQLGAHHTVLADGGQVDAVQQLTERRGRRGARLRRRGGSGERRLRDDAPERVVLRDRVRRHARGADARRSSPPSATSSATSSAPTTTWPS